MLTNPPDYEVVAIMCAAPGCGRWLTAQGRRLGELLDGSAWLCPDHAHGLHEHRPEVDQHETKEVPC